LLLLNTFLKKLSSNIFYVQNILNKAWQDSFIDNLGLIGKDK